MHPPSPPLTWVSENRNTQGWPAPPAWRVMRFRSSRHSVVVYDFEIWTANPTSSQANRRQKTSPNTEQTQNLLLCNIATPDPCFES
jgi:hypothetical protein